MMTYLIIGGIVLALLVLLLVKNNNKERVMDNKILQGLTDLISVADERALLYGVRYCSGYLTLRTNLLCLVSTDVGCVTHSSRMTRYTQDMESYLDAAYETYCRHNNR